MKAGRSVLSIVTGVALCVSLLSSSGFAWAQADPPSRVARLSYIDGPVTFTAAGSEDWTYAVRNRPLTGGDQVWVDEGGRAELHIGSAALQLGERTSLAFSDLNDQVTQLSLPQGVLNIRLRALAPGQSFEIDTPNLAFNLRQPGAYRIDVDSERQTTAIIVRAGSGVAAGDGGESFSVLAQQQAVFYGTSLEIDSMGDAPPYDDFDNWVLQREQREDQSIAARYVSREMIGYEELDDYGSWRNDERYGAVWIPRISVANWAPYHFGHWVWIAPWGWSWIDDAPWGFAPCHYGRWAYLDSHWAWVPGPRHVRPMYAPALVAFLGGSGRFDWGVALSNGRPGVAWFALAPGEPYRPAYHASPAYFGNMNRAALAGRQGARNFDQARHLNRLAPHAIAAVPAAAFVRGQPVPAALRPLDAAQLAGEHARPAPALAPVKESFVGTAKPAPAYLPPPQLAQRAVIATRMAAPPLALHDTLAQQFNARNGAAAGAGMPLVRQLPAGSARIGRPARVISGAPAVRPSFPPPAPAGAQPGAGSPTSGAERTEPPRAAPRLFPAPARGPAPASRHEVAPDRTPNPPALQRFPGALTPGTPPPAAQPAPPVLAPAPAREDALPRPRIAPPARQEPRFQPQPPVMRPGPAHVVREAEPQGAPMAAPAPRAPMQVAPGVRQQVEQPNLQRRENAPVRERFQNEERLQGGRP